jgi:hypothetical protein
LQHLAVGVVDGDVLLSKSNDREQWRALYVAGRASGFAFRIALILAVAPVPVAGSALVGSFILSEAGPELGEGRSRHRDSCDDKCDGQGASKPSSESSV